MAAPRVATEANNANEGRLAPEQIKTVTEDPNVEQSWVMYSTQTTININESKSDVLLIQAPKSTDLSPFPINETTHRRDRDYGLRKIRR